MGEGVRRKPYIDVMENVFGGVRISPDGEPQARDEEFDMRRRPWLTGVSMSKMHLSFAREDDDVSQR